ncbi:2,3-bisphosphoglycerate-independent phosphoglycerate mutase [Mesoterricola silvestris]|uniref:2,3-bisphosphoglycerate-independent phosphoglycerate mutase n=1 Tax=Mesoterricola silvestris TaxID=2927979 RepID=A0AA48GYZ2_9BACT|nr:2,3-bisphosphoglycerate-independent phosphoglycerate mutase [Mesoterricola silvestris]BDU74446.1 2,3-bisphosphoglycerate-independent phosphoglycerate mutase [Mesoterricola silvestris]
MIQGPVTLLILDGFGDGPRNAFDATFVAGMAHMSGLRRRFAATQLNAGGEAVGLPEGQFGNSEVGHMNLGAGRVVWQELTRIDAAIRKGTFRENPAMGGLLKDLKASGKRLHLLGLVSDGGVHSHQNHLVALAQWAQAEGVPTVIHAFLDGRDTEQKSADGYLQWLAFQLRNCPLVAIGSIMGRYVVMDRDKRWERVARAWKLLAEGTGEFQAGDAQEAIQAAYGRGETDEFVSPTRLEGFQPLQDGDGAIFFNFRADRARELSHALVDPAFDGFPRPVWPRISLVTFTAYETDLEPHVAVAYPPQNLTRILGELVAERGWEQLRTAETEKYAHVTYFFNGGREEPFPGEERILVPSPKVATYELQPEMSAHEVVRGLVKAIEAGRHRLLVCNLANPDMVGHTGDLNATSAACAVVDDAIRQIADATLARDGALLITADHGNCECMRDEKGNPHTAHTTNPVPAVLVARGFEARQLRAGGALCDVAPTLLKLLGMEQPAEMDGTSLF